MDCTRGPFAWMSFILAASPIVALGQFEQGGAEPPAETRRQLQPQETQPQERRELAVVATVNGDPITQGEVQATLQPRLQGRQVDPQTAAKLQKQVVENLIQSRLIEQYALDKGPDVEEQEVKAVIDRFKGQLAAQEVSLDQYLVSRGHTTDSFEDRVKGSLAWQKVQQREITDEKLARYYEENQQQFNAVSFEQARKEVVNAYIGKLWEQIIGQMKPEAEIRGGPAARPAAPRSAAPQPAPQRQQPPPAAQ